MAVLQKKIFLIIEPFYGGSHKKLIDELVKGLQKDSFDLITMRPKKWHWRARTSALYISTQISKNNDYLVLFCTSVLPLAELLGIRSDLAKLFKVVYFHENQLTFPVRITKERDFQYGFNEITTCMAADKILFNSRFNKNSFLSKIDTHLKLQPDYKVTDLANIIEPKCKVVYFPLNLSYIDIVQANSKNEIMYNNLNHNILHMIWPHRWEFDKNPEMFFRVVNKLKKNGLDFRISILGESFQEKPDIFSAITEQLQDRLFHCGFLESNEEYYGLLQKADIVVSTADHEFFGVAVLEAVYCGCIPVVPKRLVYEELYGDEVKELYTTEDELYEILKTLCHQKQNGELKQDYRYLARPYDSQIWLSQVIEILNLYND